MANSPFSAPRAAYVHVPFCRHRCGYCNFTLVAGRDDLVDDYLRAIELELAALGEPREVDTLFFGGGTPTHLPPDKLRRLLDDRAAVVSAGRGLRVQRRGQSGRSRRRRCWRCWPSAGVNRLSLGGQSFDAAKLRAAGTRPYGRSTAPAARAWRRRDRLGFARSDLWRARRNARRLAADLASGPGAGARSSFRPTA